MNETTVTARRQLVDYIGGKEVVDRPFNFKADEAWTTTQQTNWAILQIKMALRYNAGGNYKDFSFDEGDEVAQSPEPCFIGINSGHLKNTPALKDDPKLLKLAVKAFAEAAGQDPKTVTVCSAMRAGFFRSALNLFKEPTCLATSDGETAERLIDFAVNAKMSGYLTDNPLKFDR